MSHLPEQITLRNGRTYNTDGTSRTKFGSIVYLVDCETRETSWAYEYELEDSVLKDLDAQRRQDG